MLEVAVLTVLLSPWFASEGGPTEHPSINGIPSRLNKTGIWATAFYLMEWVWWIGPD